MTTLDTHEIVENLQAAGMPKPQAEAVMRAIKSREDHAFAQLATKDDLKAVRADLAAVRDELKSAIQPLASRYEVSRVETRLIMWMVGTAIALFGLLKAFP